MREDDRLLESVQSDTNHFRSAMRLGISLGALAASQLVASLLIQLTVLALVGAGRQTDAWIAAQAAPMVVASILAVAVQGAWQSRLAVAASELSRWLATQRTAQGQLLLMFGPLAALLAVTAPAWVGALFAGFTADQQTATVRMTRVLLCSALLNSQATLLTTALRACSRFMLPEFVSLGGAAVAVILIFATLPTFGIEAAVWIGLLRSVLVCATLFFVARCPVPSLLAAWKDKEGWRRAKPILLGSSIYKASPLVDRYWSSLAPAGGMTLLSLAQTGMAAISSVLERALCMPVVPNLARFAAANDFVSMRAIYRRSVLHVLVAAAAVLVGTLSLYPVWYDAVGPLLKLDEATSFQLWWLVLLLIGYLFPATAGSIVVSSFYALGDTRTPAVVGVVGFCVSIALKAAGFLALGLIGLALATAAHYLGNTLVMCWMLERRLSLLSVR